MSHLAIQISFAAVISASAITFLIIVVSASAPDTNPKCDDNKCKGSSVCVRTRDHLGNGLDYCFDKLTPSGKNGTNKAVFQAYLVTCYENTDEKECSACCDQRVTGGKSYGKVTNEFCLCKLLN